MKRETVEILAGRVHETRRAYEDACKDWRLGVEKKVCEIVRMCAGITGRPNQYSDSISRIDYGNGEFHVFYSDVEDLSERIHSIRIPVDFLEKDPAEVLRIVEAEHAKAVAAREKIARATAAEEQAARQEYERLKARFEGDHVS